LPALLALNACSLDHGTWPEDMSGVLPVEWGSDFTESFSNEIGRFHYAHLDFDNNNIYFG